MFTRLAPVCAFAVSLLAPAAYAQTTIKVGFTAALSGDFAAFGVNMRNGLQIALDQLNAKNPDVHYEMVSADDRGEAREGVLIAQRFCSDDSVDVVLGYSSSSIALAAVPIYTQCKLPVLASATTSPELSGSSPYFRRNVLTDSTQGQLMGRYASQELGLSRIYILNQQDDYGIGVAGAFRKAAEEKSEIVGQDSYQLGTKDFKTLLTKARAAKPDAIFIGGFYSEASKIATQARGLGIKAQFLGTDGALNPELIAQGGKSVEGLIAYGMFDPSIATPATQPFMQAFESQYHESPSAWSALGYDAGMTVDAAIHQALGSGEVTRVSINDAFSQVKDVPGVTGPTTFDKQGNRQGTLYFLKVDQGHFALADKQ